MLVKRCQETYLAGQHHVRIVGRQEDKGQVPACEDGSGAGCGSLHCFGARNWKTLL